MGLEPIRVASLVSKTNMSTVSSYAQTKRKCKLPNIKGGITQLAECWFVTPKVASSSLVSPEIY